MIKLPVDYDGLTAPARRAVREEYQRLQEGKCYYCRCPLDGQPHPEVVAAKVDTKLFPTGFFGHPVHLHHSHETGKTLGAVHARCNAVLWQFFGE